MAAPTLNGEVAHGSASGVSTTTITLTLTADVVGNMLLLAFSTGSGTGASLSSATDSRGNTYQQATTNTITGVQRLHAVAGRMDRQLKIGDTITITLTGIATRWMASALDYSNAHLTATAVDQTSIGSGTSTAPLSAATTATTVADEIVIGLTLWQSGNTTDYSSAGAGFTQRGTKLTDGTTSMALEDKTVAATGAQTSAATLGSSLPWVQLTVCVRGSVRWYVDYNKADDTGAGTSWATAKKNLSAITPKSGDTITMAKATDPAAQTGTMTFTDNSTSVATSADLTAALAAKDMIGPYTGSDMIEGDGWWEISSLTASTITLGAAYSGTTRTTVTGYRYNGFDVGSPATAATVTVGTASVAGTAASPITVIGGYNTGNDTRDGVSHFRVSSATKNGQITLSSQPFHYLSYVGGSRHAKTIVFNSGTLAVATHFFCAAGNGNAVDSNAQGGSGLYCYVANFLITGVVASGQTTVNFQAAGCRAINGRLENSGSIATTNNNWVESCTVRRSSAGGILLQGDFCTVVNCTLTFNGSYGVTCASGIMTGWISGCTLSNNTTADFKTSGTVNANAHFYIANCANSSVTLLGATPGNFIHFDRYNQTAKSYRTYQEKGTFLSNTANARTNTCIEMQPTCTANVNAETEVTDGKMHMDFIHPIPVKGSGTLTVTVWVKASSTWNGKIRRFGLKYMGQWVSGSPSVVSIVPGGSYRQYTLTYTMVAADTVEFVAHIDGTAGSVYVSDLAWSMT